MGLTPGSGRSPGGHSNLLQYFSLENPMDREAWWATQSIGSQRVRLNWAHSLGSMSFLGSLLCIQEVGMLLNFYLLFSCSSAFCHEGWGWVWQQVSAKNITELREIILPPLHYQKMKERLLTDIRGTLNIINQVDFIFLLKQLLKTAVILLFAAF